MHRTSVAIGLCGLLLACPRLDGQQGTVDPARRETVPAMDRAAGSGPRSNVHVRLLHNNSPAAARVSIAGGDGQSYGPAGVAIRKTRRGEPYFYTDGSFDVELPPDRIRMTVSGGLESIPQVVTVEAGAATELTVPLQH